MVKVVGILSFTSSLFRPRTAQMVADLTDFFLSLTHYLSLSPPILQTNERESGRSVFVWIHIRNGTTLALTSSIRLVERVCTLCVCSRTCMDILEKSTLHEG